MSASPVRVLFVCMGNICRSPAGENVFAHLLKQNGREEQISCDSAGTIGYHVGEAPDARMSQAGANRGIPFSGRSRKFTTSDFKNFDLILTMDEANLKDVLAQTDNPDDKKKVLPFCQFVKNFPDREVPDPYYGGSQGFEHVMDLMEDGCQNLLETIIETHQLP